MKRLCEVFVAILIFCSCKNEPSSAPVQTLNDIMQADSAGDIDRVISLYADDAILIPSTRGDIVGINAIRENYRNIFAYSTLQLKATANEIIESRDLTTVASPAAPSARAPCRRRGSPFSLSRRQ